MPVLIAQPGYRDRAERMTAELRVAFSAMERRQFFELAAEATRMTGHVFVRRVARLGKAIAGIGRGALDEGIRALDAGHHGRLAKHTGERGRALVDTVKDTYARMRTRAIEFGAVVRDPAQLPEALVTVAVALVSSGGLDANGGIPDLDLEFGIGAHRSIFTHSIIAGSLVEGSLYGIAKLVGLTYTHLPVSHDPLWDTIDRNRGSFLASVTAGVSVGLAYHLLIDGTLQPGTYHDLPIHLPLGGHEAVLVANAAAEAIDVPSKKHTFQKART